MIRCAEDDASILDIEAYTFDTHIRTLRVLLGGYDALIETVSRRREVSA